MKTNLHVYECMYDWTVCLKKASYYSIVCNYPVSRDSYSFPPLDGNPSVIQTYIIPDN